jgi:glycosyltransferase involved in cell wall biosynthesis
MGWKTQETEAIFSAMKHKNSVSFTGYVSDSELNRISAASIALCFVSFLEGFGIPALEAMYSEAPVIASRGGALPEVCGEAAYYVNPESPDSILQGLLQLAKDDNYRLELIQKGRQRRTEFSWDKAAAQTWEVLERATRHVK